MINNTNKSTWILDMFFAYYQNRLGLTNGPSFSGISQNNSYTNVANQNNTQSYPAGVSTYQDKADGIAVTYLNSVISGQQFQDLSVKILYNAFVTVVNSSTVPADGSQRSATSAVVASQSQIVLTPDEQLFIYGAYDPTNWKKVAIGVASTPNTTSDKSYTVALVVVWFP